MKQWKKSPWVLRFVPDWFVTLQEMEDDKLITWRDGYIKRKTQKKSKEELMSVAWHPD